MAIDRLECGGLRLLVIIVWEDSEACIISGLNIEGIVVTVIRIMGIEVGVRGCIW